MHAKVVVDGRDRKRFERLCRYVARPPLSQDRLELHPDGRVRLAFKAAWKDGTHAVLLDPSTSSRGSAPSSRRRTFASLAMRTINEVTCSATTASSARTPPRAPRSSSAASPSLHSSRSSPPPTSPRSPLPRPKHPATHGPGSYVASVLGPSGLCTAVELVQLHGLTSAPLRTSSTATAVDVTTCPVQGCGGRMLLVEIAKGPDDIARVLASEGPLRARDPPRRSVPAPRPGQLCPVFG
ncbi:MAG: transposase [Myxococcales bacterium]|nr:transposase [Myxococcales bacterium]